MRMCCWSSSWVCHNSNKLPVIKRSSSLVQWRWLVSFSHVPPWTADLHGQSQSKLYCFNNVCIFSHRLQRKTFRWSHSWKEKDKRCSTRSALTCFRSYNRHIPTIVWSLITCVFCLLCGQFEQLTQVKSAFEIKMQRQHELNEVNSHAYHSI